MKFGFIDLAVVCIVVFAVWTRTPVGGLGRVEGLGQFSGHGLVRAGRGAGRRRDG